MSKRGWVVKRLHSNAHQIGLPDLYCVHKLYGYRFIKAHTDCTIFSEIQYFRYDAMSHAKLGVWVFEDMNDVLYRRLWEPPNWKDYTDRVKKSKYKKIKVRPLVGPEAKIQAAIIAFLRARHWFVCELHGNMYQSGLPDLLAGHASYGKRLIEVKLPEMKGSRFTDAQIETFHELAAAGDRIWIMTAADAHEYRKILNPRANLSYYLGEH